MEKLSGIHNKGFEQGLTSSKSTKTRSVNISMPEHLVEDLNQAVEDSDVSSRSEYVREKLKGEL